MSNSTPGSDTPGSKTTHSNIYSWKNKNNVGVYAGQTVGRLPQVLSQTIFSFKFYEQWNCDLGASGDSDSAQINIVWI